MVVVVDTNIFISSIIHINGPVAALLLHNSTKIDFTAPEFVIQEVISKETKICKKEKLNQKDFRTNLSIITDTVFLLKDEMLSDTEFKKAYDIVKSVDPDDTIYLAFAMALDAFVWTGDKKRHNYLRRKKINYSVTTPELKEIIKGL
jgi:predicted nucleic acid-binding protein